MNSPVRTQLASGAPAVRSSGDLIADRRYALARDLQRRGDIAAAADLLGQALERAENFCAAWFALGEVRQRLGDSAGAVEAFRRALALDPDDAQGASLRLARLEARTAPMPQAYVRTLFDQYAPRYDRALVEELSYRAPHLLRDAVERAQAGRGRPLRFRRMLDLGCGTGLAGERFADCCETMIGVDLSPAMIERARDKNLYSDLIVADLVEALARPLPRSAGENTEPHTRFPSPRLRGEGGEDRRSEPGEGRPHWVESGSHPRARADLIVAADVFVYLADLEPVCRAAARALEPGGLFAFTTETHAREGVVLGEKLRYAHSAAHVRAALAAAGLSALILAPASPRKEAGGPVAGLVVVAGH
jgi:predicted TPR repeat methyltransferase